jgi:hypothetical protein
VNKPNRRKNKAQKQSNQMPRDGASLARYQSQYARHMSIGDDFLAVDDAVEAERNYQYAEHCLRMIAAISPPEIPIQAPLSAPEGSVYPEFPPILQNDDQGAGQGNLQGDSLFSNHSEPGGFEEVNPCLVGKAPGSKRTNNRLLPKPSESSFLEGREAPERRNGAYSDVREHASTGSTYQKTDYEEFRKKPNPRIRKRRNENNDKRSGDNNGPGEN